MPKNETGSTGIFDIQSIADSLPDTATTLLVDKYLTNREQASARVFRVYSPDTGALSRDLRRVPLCLLGKGNVLDEGCVDESRVRPGQLLFFERGTVHAMPELFEHPVVFLSVDTPRREPTDIIFVDPKDGSPETFMERNAVKP